MTAPIAVVVGNPSPRSRTLAVAGAIATAAAAAAGLDPGAERLVVDLADHATQLFDRGSDEVADLVRRVGEASLVVVASPTYKATYTGLLKAFLDWFDQTGMAGAVAIPVMVGAAPIHALAVEVHLRPLLVEIGAAVPTRGLFVQERQLDTLDTVIDQWLEQARPHLRGVVRRRA